MGTYDGDSGMEALKAEEVSEGKGEMVLEQDYYETLHRVQTCLRWGKARAAK